MSGAGRFPAARGVVRRRSRTERITQPPGGDARIAAIRTAGATGELRVVVLEDRRRFRLDAEQTSRLGLEVGGLLDPGLLAALERQDASRRARETAVRLLAVRPRSVAELRERLRRAGTPSDITAAVVDDLAAAGYLDDLAFAQSWVRNRAAVRPSGVLRLRAELRKKGIANSLIEQAIHDLDGEEEAAVAEERRARELVERRLRAYARLAWDARVRRLAGLLQRRGFATHTIARVLRTVERRIRVGTTDA